MPDNTEARDIEELGTTIYDRADEIASIAMLLSTLPSTVSRELFKAHELGETIAALDSLTAEVSRLGMRLNPNACADSHERNGEPLELAVEGGRKITRFTDASGDGCVVRGTSHGIAPMLLMGIEDEYLMVLSRQHVAALLPHLKRFVETGEL